MKHNNTEKEMYKQLVIACLEQGLDKEVKEAIGKIIELIKEDSKIIENILQSPAAEAIKISISSVLDTIFMKIYDEFGNTGLEAILDTVTEFFTGKDAEAWRFAAQIIEEAIDELEP